MAQTVEDPYEEARDLHLADSQLVRDLFPDNLLDEAQPQEVPLLAGGVREGAPECG
ncbi:hypothetical protein SAT01_24640 [Sinomonas atrocyanea]|nr:hypothetical protein SAT01_24640 [Sinomonas atrocyanea]GGG61467.1 hypothetical protein GCM10007172_10650 [Sinomonas atrocyanea]